MELLYGLSVEAEAEVVKGPLSRVRELAEKAVSEGRLIDPRKILEILEETR